MSDNPATKKFDWLRAAARDPKVSSQAFEVGAAIMQLANRNGICRQPLTKIAEEVGWKYIRHIPPRIQELVDAGYLESKRAGWGHYNAYRIIFPDWTKPSNQRMDETVQSERTEPSNQQNTDWTKPSNLNGPNGPNIFPSLPVKEERLPVKNTLGASRDEFTEAAFQEWMSAYPLRRDEDEARNEYRTALQKGLQRDGSPVTVISLLAAAKRYRAEREGQPDQFTKSPAKWLKAGKWKDQPIDYDDDGKPSLSKAMDTVKEATRRAAAKGSTDLITDTRAELDRMDEEKRQRKAWLRGEPEPNETINLGPDDYRSDDDPGDDGGDDGDDDPDVPDDHPPDTS